MEEEFLLGKIGGERSLDVDNCDVKGFVRFRIGEEEVGKEDENETLPPRVSPLEERIGYDCGADKEEEEYGGDVFFAIRITIGSAADDLKVTEMRIGTLKGFCAPSAASRSRRRASAASRRIRVEEEVVEVFVVASFCSKRSR